MLHKETVESGTLDLIKKLQGDPVLDKFILVGGTALALMIGHRSSIDIDLFTTEDFEAQLLLEHLEKTYNFSLQFMHRNTIKGIVDHVFVDLITHPYPHIRSEVVLDGVSISSKEDIAAMKLNAIVGNGSRVKDFIDIYFLLNEYSIQEILEFYSEKYQQRNTFHAIKSLTYFDDMDSDPWPNMILEKNLTPKKLKTKLISHSQAFFRHL